MRLGHVLVALSLLVGMADWLAVGRGNRRAEYILKPLVLVLLIAAAVAFGDRVGTLRWALTVVALVFSLAGDTFLMLPRDLFIVGLGSFLLAHLAYVAAFNTAAPPFVLTAVASGAVVLVGGAVFSKLRAGMVRMGSTELLFPVTLYALAIVAMVVSAIATAGRPDWTAGASALAIGGALLFLVSDGVIGWMRFVRPLRWGPLAIIVTYHLAQAGLVLGLLG